MVDVRFSQIVRETSAQNTDAEVLVSQIVRIVSVEVVPSFLRISQVVRIVSGNPPIIDKIRLSQLVRIVSALVPDIGTACEVEPIPSETNQPALVRGDWISSVEMETAWLTDVAWSKVEKAEDRTIGARRPVRTIRALCSGLTQREALRVQNYAARLAKNRNPVPLWQDRRTLRSNATGTTLDVDTRWRRFYRGQHVGIARPDGQQILGKDVLLLTIAAKTDDTITLTSAVPTTLLAGWDVYPMMDCEIVPKVDVHNETDQHASIQVEALELSGCSTLPASCDEADIDLYYPTYGNYPVLDVDPNWGGGVASDVERAVEAFQSGRGRGISASGERGVPVFQVDFGVVDREGFWKVLCLHDSRAGRGRGVWVVHPQSLWRHVGSGTDYVDIEPDGYSADILEFYDHVAMVEPDGTLTIRPIVSVSEETSPARWRLHLDPLTLAAPSPLARITPAALCRGDSDSLKEVWKNEDVCSELKMAFQGLLREEDISLG